MNILRAKQGRNVFGRNPGQNPTGENPTQTKPHQAKPHSDTTPLTYTNFWTKPHF